MAMKDLFLQEAHVNDTVFVVVGPKDFTGEIVSLTDDLMKLKVEDRTLTLALDAIAMYEIISVAEDQKTSEDIPQPSSEEKSQLPIEETSPDEIAEPDQEDDSFGEEVKLVVQTGNWIRNLKKINVNEFIKSQCLLLDPSNLLLQSLLRIVNDLKECANEGTIKSIYNRTPTIAKRILDLYDQYHFQALPELLKVMLLNMDEYSVDLLGKDVELAEIDLADAYKADHDGDVNKACTFLDRYLRMIDVADRDIETVMYFARYASTRQQLKHPIFTDDANVSFKKDQNLRRYTHAKTYVLGKLNQMAVQQVTYNDQEFDEQDLCITIPLTYWTLDLGQISGKKFQSVCKEVDSSGNMYNDLNKIINKLFNSYRINELALRYNRTQEIALMIVKANKSHPHLLFRELLMVLLINVDEYSAQIFKQETGIPEVAYADAYKAYMSDDIQRACDALNRYFSLTALTDINFSAFHYFARYGGVYGYSHHHIFNLPSVSQLSAALQDVYARDCSYIKAQQVMQMPAPKVIVDDQSTTEVLTKVDRLINRARYKEARDYLQEKTQLDPYNDVLIKRFGEVNDMVVRANKFLRSMPSDSLANRANRARFIEEDYDKAERLYLETVNTHAKGYTGAFLSYVDMVMKAKGNEEEIATMLKYKRHFMDSPKNKISFYERLVNAYERSHDNQNRLDNLKQLLKAYEATGQQAKIANTYYRIAQCYYSFEDYRSALDVVELAFDNGLSFNIGGELKVTSYLQLDRVDEAQKYVEKNYHKKDAQSLLDLINEYIENREVINAQGDGAVVNALLSSKDAFIEQYIKNAGELPESITADELEAQEKRLNRISYDEYSTLADGYLIAALMAEKLNDDYKYNVYLAASLYNRGVLYHKNQHYDVARSYYIAALTKSHSNRRTTLIDNLVNYYIMTLRGTFNPNIIGLDKELRLLKVNQLSLNELKALMLLLINYPQLITIVDKNEHDDYLNAIKRYLNGQTIDLTWDYLEEIVTNQASNERKKMREVVGLFKNDTLFNVDYSDELIMMKPLMYVSDFDAQCIDRLLPLYQDILKAKIINDYDDRLRILTRIVNDLDNQFDLRGTTLFIEQYFMSILTAITDHLAQLIKTTQRDFKPSLNLQVPIVDVIDSNGSADFSISITNETNRATANSIELSLKDVNSVERCHTFITQTLKGGSTEAVLINLSHIQGQALTLNPEVSYQYNNETYVEQLPQFSIAMRDDHFEKIQNPYIDGHSLKLNQRQMFYGREEMIDMLASQLRDDNVEAVAIYGQKRTGKSSIFEFLKERLQSDFMIVDIDASSTMSSERSFYDAVRINIVELFEVNDVDDDILDELDDMDVSDFVHFNRLINKANKVIDEEGLPRLLIMIDEFTSLYGFIQDETKDIDGVFINRLKTMVDDHLFKMAMIGQDSMEDFISAFPNQFQSIDLNRVNYLKMEDAIKLIKEPIALNGQSRYLENSDVAIASWFNGQPYYIQRYCKKLVETMNTHQYTYVTMAIAQSQKAQMIKDENSAFVNNLVEESDRDGFDVVTRIAKSNDQVDGWVNLDHLNFDEHQMRVLKRLVHKEVVDYKASTNQCRIVIPFFKDWLLSH